MLDTGTSSDACACLAPSLLEVLCLGALERAEPLQAAHRARREQCPFPHHDAPGLAK